MAEYIPHKLKPLVEKMIQDGRLSHTLYTYMPVDKLEERVIPVLSECKLWFSSPKDFNDPFDCKIYPRVPENDILAAYLIDNAENVNPNDHDAIRGGILAAGGALIRQAIDDVMNRSGVKCFTTDNTNILMWSHYTNSHKGICLEFNTILDPEFFVYPINVIYSEDYPQLEFTDKKFTTEVLRTKSKVWEYEKEVRIYKRSNGYHTFNPESLRSITFGCNISNEHKEAIMNVVRQNKALSHVRFFQCSPHPTQFKLGIKFI